MDVSVSLENPPKEVAKLLEGPPTKCAFKMSCVCVCVFVCVCVGDVSRSVKCR